MEVVINRNDVEKIIKSYEKENSDFVLKNYILNTANKAICTFYLEGRECKLNIFFKNKTVNFSPTGKNTELTIKLVEYIASKGFDNSELSKNVSVSLSRNQLDELLRYIKDECNGFITFEVKQNNQIVFHGYNEDKVVLNYYESSKKAVFQGKPFYSFNLILTYLANISDFSLDEIVDINNQFNNMNTPMTFIRSEMKQKLNESYNYLEESLLKFISGSLTLLQSNNICEDYVGYLAGTFKALEGYLKKILSQKFKYTLKQKSTFSMLGKNAEGKSEIDYNNLISNEQKRYLHLLYNMYNDKRNVYLHATVDPNFNKIIDNKQEAVELTDEILKLISDSYNIFYK